MPVALAAVPVEIFLAAALLLLLYAVQTLIAKPLVALLEHVPLIGGTVAGAINDVVGTVIGWAEGWVRWGVDALVQLVHVPIQAIQDFIAMVAGFGDTVADALSHLWAVASGAIGTVADSLASLASRVAGLASSVGTALSRIASLAASVAAIVATAIPGAIATVESWARALVRTATDALDGALRAVIAATRAGLLLAITAAAAPLQALLALVPSQILQAVAVAVRPIALGLEGLGQEVGQAIGQITARLGNLEKLLPLLGLLPLVGAIPVAIETFWRTKAECTDPTCGLLGDLLQGVGPVGELLTGSVLLYLVSESIHDPEGAAREVHGWHDELAGLASGVTQVLAGRAI